MQPVVEAALGQQFRMGALFGDAALVHHQHSVRLLHGLQPMGDEDGGASGGQPVQSALDELFGFRVDGGGGFVEHQDFRVRRQHPGEGQQLPLPLGEVLAALRQLGVETLRQGLYEVLGVDRFGRRLDLLSGDGGVGQGDVVRHAAGEDVEVLQHHADAPPQVAAVDAVKVDAVQEDAAVRKVVEAPQQPDQGAFAGPGGTDDGQLLARCDVQGNILEHWLVLAVGEAQMAELHGALEAFRQCGRFGRLMHRLVPIQGLEDALTAGHGAEQHVGLLAQHDDGMQQHIDEPGEQHHAAQRQLLLQHRPGAVVEDQADG